MILLRLFGFSTWIGLLLYMINSALMSWSGFTLSNWIWWAGLGCGLIAVPSIWWMFFNLGKNVTDTVSIRNEHNLIITGLYRLIQHPMYSFSFLAFLAFSLLTQTGLSH